MDHSKRLEGVREAQGADLSGGRVYPDLGLFDRVREILILTGLPVDPGTYELLYLYVSGADAMLVQAVEQALADGDLNTKKVQDLRRNHLGDIAGAAVLALVNATQQTANRIVDRLDQAYANIKDYDTAISTGEEALSTSQSAEELTQLVERLRRTNASMLASNRQLEVDIQAAAEETSQLLDRLESAERSARTDPLTNLLNRRGLMETLKHTIAQAVEGETALSIALVDIDHFRRLNDQWGHNIGDEILRCVGNHLQKDVRNAVGKDAFAGRYGGEEFLVALPTMALPQAISILDNSRARLARLVLRRTGDDAHLGRVTFSAGIAQLRIEDTLDTLVDRADSALYNAKRFGRDRVIPERSSGSA